MDRAKSHGALVVDDDYSSSDDDGHVANKGHGRLREAHRRLSTRKMGGAEASDDTPNPIDGAKKSAQHKKLVEGWEEDYGWTASLDEVGQANTHGNCTHILTS